MLWFLLSPASPCKVAFEWYPSCYCLRSYYDMSTWTATTDSEYVQPCPTNLRKVSSTKFRRLRNARKFPMIQMGFDISNNAVATHQSSYAMSFAPMPSRFNVHFKPGVHFSSLSPISVGHTTALQTRQATESTREARIVRQSLEVEIL